MSDTPATGSPGTEHTPQCAYMRAASRAWNEKYYNTPSAILDKHIPCHCGDIANLHWQAAAFAAAFDALWAERDALTAELALYREERSAFIVASRNDAGHRTFGKEIDMDAKARLARARMALMDADPCWADGTWPK